MTVLPDPNEIRAVADRITAQAGALRERAHALARTDADLAWRGMAATSFDGASDHVLRALRHAAGRLDAAAHTLRGHADAVEHTLAMLYRWQAAIEHTGVDLVHRVAESENPEHLLHTVGSLFGGGGDGHFGPAALDIMRTLR